MLHLFSWFLSFSKSLSYSVIYSWVLDYILNYIEIFCTFVPLQAPFPQNGIPSLFFIFKPFHLSMFYSCTVSFIKTSLASLFPFINPSIHPSIHPGLTPSWILRALSTPFVRSLGTLSGIYFLLSVVGWMMAPQKTCLCPKPWTLWIWAYMEKKVFADIINLRTLRWDHPGLPG